MAFSSDSLLNLIMKFTHEIYQVQSHSPYCSCNVRSYKKSVIYPEKKDSPKFPGRSVDPLWKYNREKNYEKTGNDFK